MDIIILAIIAVFGLALAIAFYKEILSFITKLNDRIRIFIFENKSLIDISFLLIYAVIQLVFVLEISRPGSNISLVITLFVLSLLTVLGIERLCLKSRFNFLDNQMSDLHTTYLLNEADYQRALQREKELIGRYRNLKVDYEDVKKENKELSRKKRK